MVDDPELWDQVRVGGDSEQRHCYGGLLHRRRRPRPSPHLRHLWSGRRICAFTRV